MGRNWTEACIGPFWKVHKMIRVFTADRPNSISLTVDGRLVGEYVAAVETSTCDAIQENKPVHLFLRDVSHIDEQGQKLLSQLAAKGVQLRASGVYSCFIVDEIRRELSRRRRCH